MPQLLDLSAELVLNIAFFLRQVDLLNISLTCKVLHQVTERELFREYRNRRIVKSCSTIKFVLRIIRNPELAKYVKSLDLKEWEHSDTFNYRYLESAAVLQTVQGASKLNEHRELEPTEEEYNLCAKAAQSSGVIKNIYPYDSKSGIGKRERPILWNDEDVTTLAFFNRHLIADQTMLENMSFDEIFCHLLRVGINEVYTVLLLAILPNVQNILLCGTIDGPTTLDWPSPNHGFKTAHRIVAGGTNLQSTWGVARLNTILASAKLKELMVRNASSWIRLERNGFVDKERTRSLVLQPRSLSLTRLELILCNLKYSDLKTLIDACPQLRSLKYDTGVRRRNICDYGVMAVIKLLGGLQATLEELYLELFPFRTDLDAQYIVSLHQFTALKILDTTPSMWNNMLDGDINTRGLEILPSDQRLSNRLPPSLETLSFHVPSTNEIGSEVTPAPCQIVDVVLERAQKQPNLRAIFLGLPFEAKILKMQQALAEIEEHVGDLDINIGIGGSAYGPTRTAFDDVPIGSKLPFIRWFGNKYAAKSHIEREYDAVISNLCTRPENQGLSDQEMLAVIQNDSRVNELLEQLRLNGGFAEVQYNSDDTEED